MIRDSIAKSHPEVRAAAPVHDPFRPGDITHSRADIGRAGKALGYEPIYRVAEGLPLVVEWYLREQSSPMRAAGD